MTMTEECARLIILSDQWIEDFKESIEAFNEAMNKREEHE